MASKKPLEIFFRPEADIAKKLVAEKEAMARLAGRTVSWQHVLSSLLTQLFETRRTK